MRRVKLVMWLAAMILAYGVMLKKTLIIAFPEKAVASSNGITKTSGQSFVVIDSGHGFFDAGKIGVSGAEEKEINLAIALKLKKYLMMQGVEVRMTREDDQALYDGTRPADKKEDMKKRIALLNAPGCVLAVSIHQNSFTEEKYKGAQVFYYQTSQEGRQLAMAIQGAFIEFQDTENTRQEKANETYYLLKKATVPTVICECGFLSNGEEESRLQSEDYQEKTAWAISVGIMRYLNEGHADQ